MPIMFYGPRVHDKAHGYEVSQFNRPVRKKRHEMVKTRPRILPTTSQQPAARGNNTVRYQAPACMVKTEWKTHQQSDPEEVLRELCVVEIDLDGEDPEEKRRQQGGHQQCAQAGICIEIHVCFAVVSHAQGRRIARGGIRGEENVVEDVEVSLWLHQLYGRKLNS